MLLEIFLAIIYFAFSVMLLCAAFFTFQIVLERFLLITNPLLIQAYLLYKGKPADQFETDIR